MSGKTRIAIVGATSSMATHCARLWASGKPVDLTLIGRDTARLDRIASDIRVRSPQTECRVMVSDFFDPEAVEATVNEITAFGAVDIVLIAHGFLPEQSDCQNNLSLCRETLEINGISPVLYAEAFAGHMAKAGKGTIALIGSVAGDRGRKSNYAYGAAKGLVSRYAQGLQHRLYGSGVTVLLIKPGPTDTPMTAHLKNQGARLASVESVARRIVSAIEKREAVVYVPGKWALIMMVIRHMPSWLFNRMNI